MAFAGMEIFTLYFLTVLLYNIKKHYGCENMRFCDRLNEYIETLDCTVKELSELSDISAATVSRYRSGERLPDAESELDFLKATVLSKSKDDVTLYSDMPMTEMPKRD